ncbi:MAG: rRNA pseudouridine synthase [Fibrobacteres bacterium]|nr:rRNA pseudouridine synthase [Fibrobacterota bacterium]
MEKEKADGIRINRYLALCGFGARRVCEEMVSAGRVTVNGEIVRDLGRRIISGKDEVLVSGKTATPIEEHLYIIVHKPRGYVVSHRGFPDQKTVFELLPKFPKNLNYVGRLDEESEGLLIMSTNGDFINKMTHPRYGYGKVYLVTVTRALSGSELNSFRTGMEIDEGERTIPAQIEPLEGRASAYRVILHEGKNRQIRRMMKVFGIGVIRLTRVAMGPVNLGNLECGSWRKLTTSELGKIKRDLKLKEI